MRRWVLTYPYPHPRPSDDLLGRVLPQPRHPFRRQTASLEPSPAPRKPHIPRRSTPTLVSNVLSRPPSQKLIQGRHFNRRSHHSPTSLSLSPFLPLCPWTKWRGSAKEIESGGRSFARRMTLDEENGTPPPEFYGKRVTVRKIIRLHICLRGIDFHRIISIFFIFLSNKYQLEDVNSTFR